MKSEDKQKLLEIWKMLENDQSGYYKPTEITEKQRELIYDVSRLLSRRDASILIHLLSILTKKESEDIKIL
ncbi:hypothetical protein HYU07_02080 [Candidatus Woesearchaeota archaeon]|nr:hypothetical protein [Candidatus Woesearchaeota archaeon]